MKYHEEYPLYDFDKHKGYPTLAHRLLLHKIGPCPIHRVSYKPVSDAMQLHGGNISTKAVEDCVSGVDDSNTVKNTKKKVKGKKRNHSDTSTSIPSQIDDTDGSLKKLKKSTKN